MQVTPELIRAGNATFTVDNGKGRHYTFKVRTKEDRKDETRKVSFVSLLAGPNNEADYVYMGLLPSDINHLRLTRASKMSQDSVAVRAFNFSLRLATGMQAFPEGYKLHHEGRCMRCGRKLTTPESIERGLGPECAGKDL